MKVNKERISITLTGLYLSFLDRVVKDGIYLTRSAVIRDSLRLLMKEDAILHKSKEAED